MKLALTKLLVSFSWDHHHYFGLHQHWSNGAVMVRAHASHQCGPRLISRLSVICGLSLLVLFSALRGFSPGTPVFPSPQKPTFN